jgi:hypothetical protein
MFVLITCCSKLHPNQHFHDIPLHAVFRSSLIARLHLSVFIFVLVAFWATLNLAQLKEIWEQGKSRDAEN